MPERIVISSDEAKQKSPEELFAELASSPQGLSRAEAQTRLAQYGPNALPEKKVNPFLKFLSYFWGPIPWMIEAAACCPPSTRTGMTLVIIAHAADIQRRASASGRNIRPPTRWMHSSTSSP